MVSLSIVRVTFTAYDVRRSAKVQSGARHLANENERTACGLFSGTVATVTTLSCFITRSWTS